MVHAASLPASEALTVLVTQSRCHCRECEQLSPNQEFDTGQLEMFLGQECKFSEQEKIYTVPTPIQRLCAAEGSVAQWGQAELVRF
jgi:hypothetical protein